MFGFKPVKILAGKWGKRSAFYAPNARDITIKATMTKWIVHIRLRDLDRVVPVTQETIEELRLSHPVLNDVRAAEITESKTTFVCYTKDEVCFAAETDHETYAVIQAACLKETANDPTVAKLRELKAMLESGLIVQDEYDQKRAKILAAM